MIRTQSRKTSKTTTWPRKVQPGRAIINVYRRKTPQGNFAYMVANYAEGKRRFDSYAAEADALAAADALAKRIDRRDYISASMTQAQAIEYADASAALTPFGITVRAATSTVAECLKMVGNLSNIAAAVSYYAARHKKITPKQVADVVAELLKIREERGAAKRYVEDLKYRLNRIADALHNKEIGNVTTAEVQEWLNSQGFSAQGYRDFRNRA